jgi:CRISPR-associated protein Cmr3
MTKKIQLKAADTLFFRDAKPFSMGEETWANSLFPNIPPSVLLGALRTAYASEKQLAKEEIFDKTKNISIKNYGLVLGSNLSFSIPYDLVGYEGETSGLDTCENLMSSSPFENILIGKANKKAEDLDSFRMNLSTFNSYLNGEKAFGYDLKDRDENVLLNLNDFTTAEPKTGIGRSKQTNTTREGALYRVGMTRLEGKEKENVAFFQVEVDNLDIADEGVLRLGAENKVVHYQPFTKKSTIKPLSDWNNTDCFKIYLYTPAILDKGIIPNWIDEKNEMQGEIAGIKVKLQTCAVGRFLTFGGFDIKEQKPKQMYKAVPSGSVYYFELLDKNNTEKQIQTIINHFNSNSFSEQKTEEGLGVVYIAKQ